MSARYDIVDEEFFRIMRSVISALHERTNADNITRSLLCFLVRVANTWNSLQLLRRGAPADFQSVFMVDAGVLLRCMFDAYMQADYIVRDPAKRTELATLYLEFQHVERYKAEEKLFRHNNPMTDVLGSSPRRAEGQARTRAEFERVKGPFLRKDKGSGGSRKKASETRDQWYEGNLGQLAEAAGRKDEYDTFVYPFSGCVHSSSYAVLKGPPVTAEYLMQFASTLAARVVNINIQYNGLDLGDDQLILDEMCKGVLHKD
jgi:hypothetical protein